MLCLFKPVLKTGFQQVLQASFRGNFFLNVIFCYEVGLSYENIHLNKIL